MRLRPVRPTRSHSSSGTLRSLLCDLQVGGGGASMGGCMERAWDAWGSMLLSACDPYIMDNMPTGLHDLCFYELQNVHGGVRMAGRV